MWLGASLPAPGGCWTGAGPHSAARRGRALAAAVSRPAGRTSAVSAGALISPLGPDVTAAIDATGTARHSGIPWGGPTGVPLIANQATNGTVSEMSVRKTRNNSCPYPRRNAIGTTPEPVDDIARIVTTTAIAGYAENPSQKTHRGRWFGRSGQHELTRPAGK
ncbi:hypothetical protein GCM10009760_64210 [Kitasatospora kazusensis]|uniref:Uncharacterized protein n=1 Tax=Kitasatospora kazusensis TaxID=407974 RepID=A0ABP4KD76_9ACTN